MPDPPPNRSDKKAPSGWRDDAPPWTRATAAVAWLSAAFCFVHAGALWLRGGGALSDTVFFLGVAGGAAYFALMLPRRAVPAWRACRQLTAAIGTIHLVVLPSLVVAWALWLALGAWYGFDPCAAQRTQALASAGVVTALPWAFYHALGDPRVKSWFCVANFH